MTFETCPPQPSDPDEALRQALRRLASEQGAPQAEALGRRVMADWQREVAHPAGATRQPRFADAAPDVQRHGRRRIGVTALIAALAMLLVVWIKLPASPPQQLKQVDVLSQMSFGGL